MCGTFAFFFTIFQMMFYLVYVTFYFTLLSSLSDIHRDIRLSDCWLCAVNWVHNNSNNNNKYNVYIPTQIHYSIHALFEIEKRIPVISPRLSTFSRAIKWIACSFMSKIQLRRSGKYKTAIYFLFRFRWVWIVDVSSATLLTYATQLTKNQRN